MTVANSVTELIGNTPIVRLNHLTDENDAELYAKLEYFNPGSSVKDRIALAMIEAAEKEGKLKPNDTIIEPTSGNTGIGLALVAAVKGYKAILVMPETMSIERRKLFKAYGAEVILTPGAQAIKGSIEKAQELAKEKGYFLPQQFKNPANPKVHYETTGKEIAAAFDTLDAFVAGVGTGGTLSGSGKALKEKFNDIKVYAVEPKDSPVLNGGKGGPHKIQGIGTGFVPDTLDTEIYDEVLDVTNEQAFEYARLAGKKEGVLAGISGGAAIYGGVQVAKKLGKGKKVVVIVPDNGERYLSTPLYQVEE
ncbi:cysteine synthase A [Sporolactobacillus terrae]|uniref:Cysteine synthase n=1 Tax=Sporolactobacillus terrae TaxID=269673 RepID=A0A410D552_9BACL|nr:cysteine synthase A [Sporolactobacillus terrae]QAA21238.1 cysteine synthase A [Sporolactobacillus terrae]QAA24210.1 cysteine synthase A [Sporolactobacillus terrae]UAK16019.1 cysteine synthase A [Sporolactobacillus terrae]BBN97377.1 cysteine synthase [Sporolactobacillus terrae]